MTGQVKTISGHRGLQLEEPLIFEQGAPEKSAVDLPAPAQPVGGDRLGAARRGRIGLPGLSEPEVVRHYLRLSQKNYSIDFGIISAGIVHDEAQPAAEREAGSFARAR